MTDFVSDAVAERVTGDEPSRLRAIGAAIIIGIGAAVLAYKLLRGGGDDEAPADGDDEAPTDGDD